MLCASKCVGVSSRRSFHSCSTSNSALSRTIKLEVSKSTNKTEDSDKYFYFSNCTLGLLWRLRMLSKLKVKSTRGSVIALTSKLRRINIKFNG